MRDALLGLVDSLSSKLLDPSFDVHSNPVQLASLFALASATRAERPEFESEIHRRLFQETLKWASVTSPYYQRSLSGLFDMKRLFPVDEIESIPVITRADIVRDVDAMRNRAADFSFATFTSGTTSGEPLIIDRCEAEQRYLHDFLCALARPKLSHKVFGLRLETPWHGRVLQFPSDYHPVSVSVSTVSGLKTAHSLLRRKYVHGGREHSISAIGGGLVSLHRLTAYLENWADRPTLPRITTLQSTSEYVTGRTRKWLEGYWETDLIDRFGVSEVIAGAWRCPKCHRYHFEPYGYPEVICFSTGKPIAEGVGRLVLTGYYPFMQLVPLVRYATGDAVRLFRADQCPTFCPGIELLGRISKSVMRDEALLIGENEIHDILDEYPFVRRSPVYHSFPGLEEAGAFPVFAWALDADVNVLRVPLRDGAQLSPADVERFKESVRSSLLQRTAKDWRVELT